MATPISGATDFDFGAAAQAVAASSHTNSAAAASFKQPTKTDPTGYTVKLSNEAQVRLLNEQGHSVSQISVITNLPTQAVDSYLGITQGRISGSDLHKAWRASKEESSALGEAESHRVPATALRSILYSHPAWSSRFPVRK